MLRPSDVPFIFDHHGQLYFLLDVLVKGDGIFLQMEKKPEKILWKRIKEKKPQSREKNISVKMKGFGNIKMCCLSKEITPWGNHSLRKDPWWLEGNKEAGKIFDTKKRYHSHTHNVKWHWEWKCRKKSAFFCGNRGPSRRNWALVIEHSIVFLTKGNVGANSCDKYQASTYVHHEPNTRYLFSRSSWGPTLIT